MQYNYIALHKMFPQYSDKTSKRKRAQDLINHLIQYWGKFFTQQVGRCRSCYLPSFQMALPGHDQLKVQSL